MNISFNIIQYSVPKFSLFISTQYVVLAHTDRWGIKSAVHSEQPLTEAGISFVCFMEYGHVQN